MLNSKTPNHCITCHRGVCFVLAKVQSNPLFHQVNFSSEFMLLSEYNNHITSVIAVIARSDTLTGFPMHYVISGYVKYYNKLQRQTGCRQHY